MDVRLPVALEHATWSLLRVIALMSRKLPFCSGSAVSSMVFRRQRIRCLAFGDHEG